MIEAIPLNSECIVLIITKVEDPDELDTRFSKFAPSVHQDDNALDDVLDSISDGADAVLDLFKKIQNGRTADSVETAESSAADAGSTEEVKRSFKNALQKKLSDTSVPTELTKIFSFASLREATAVSHVLCGFYSGSNSLYKQPIGNFLLVVSKSSHSPVEFNKVCNILSEYGSCIKSVSASEAYLEEHFEPVIKNTALQSLSCI